MTDIVQLFSGIGVVIDDEINVANSSIGKIALSFKEKHIPYLSYEVLPTNEEIHSFHSVSFVLLDWKWNTDASDEILLNDNIDFIREFHKVCFAPIFIFTNESPDAIINSLKTKGVYSETKNNLIFVKHKSEIDDSPKLFSAIEEWTKNTLPVYILKEWESKKRMASSNLFRDLYNLNPDWVKVFLKTSTKDGVDTAFELDELLFENLHSQMTMIDLTNVSIPDNEELNYNANEIRDVMQGQRFLLANRLSPNMIFTGDVYLKDSDGKKEYYINVRPQCDCIPRNGMSLDNVELYLLKGSEKAIDKCHYSKKDGNFADIETRVTVFPISHKAIQFELGEFSIEKFSEMKEFRIGRLLPPFITKLVQKYALYMQRQALPRIPEEATKID